MRLRRDGVVNDYDGIAGTEEDGLEENGPEILAAYDWSSMCSRRIMLPRLYSPVTNDVDVESGASHESTELSTFMGPKKRAWNKQPVGPRSLPHLASQWWNVLPEVLNLLISLLFTGEYFNNLPCAKQC